MAIHAAVLLAHERERKSDKVRSDQVIEDGKKVEAAAKELSERIKRLNGLYKDRLRNERT